MSSVRCAFELLPRIGPHLKKGECGRIAVLGGALEYTGAPFFASMGADLAYVFSPPEAATVIKSYSPELIVHPSQDFSLISQKLERFDGLVIGPGLGRDSKRLVPLLKQVLDKARTLDTLGVVIDADGLFLLADCLENVRGLRNVILTPNHREFDRLYQKVFNVDNSEDVNTKVKNLAKELQVSIFRKGEVDVISDGNNVLVGDEPACDRRCGGQGDLLAGAIALFMYYSRLKSNQPKMASSNVLEGALAASTIVRYTAKETFSKLGRSMTALDVMNQVQAVLLQFDPDSPHGIR